MTDANAYAPESLEGWYALHQLVTVDRARLHALRPDALLEARAAASQALGELAAPEVGGWSAVVPLVGSRADVMFMHFRPTLEALGAAQQRIGGLALSDVLRPAYSFLSITEVGLYHLAAHGPDDPRKQERIEAERASAHVQRRLYPTPPADMPYVSFYPMSKRRDAGQNWYTLSLEERRQLMHSHGLTGRRYAGRVLQIITGAVGFDAWEWGVTLFARDPLDFKKIVTEMRYDEASSKYAEFGEFFVGKLTEPEAWLESLVG